MCLVLFCDIAPYIWFYSSIIVAQSEADHVRTWTLIKVKVLKYT